MAAFTTMALIGLAAASAYSANKAKGSPGPAGQSAAELLSGKGPTGAELGSVNAQLPATTPGGRYSSRPTACPKA